MALGAQRAPRAEPAPRSVSAQQSPAAAALTYVAIVHPDALPVVPAPAFHHVVGVIGFSDFIVGVDDNLGSDGETQRDVLSSPL